VTFGSQHLFDAGSPRTNISVAALSATKVVVVYSNGSATNHGTAKVGTVSGTDVTYGAATEFLSSSAADQIAIGALDATKVIVTYNDNSGTTTGSARVGTVSGADITFGSVTDFQPSSGGIGSNSMAVISTTRFVVTYQDAADSSNGTSKIGTVIGTTISFGAEEEFRVGSVFQISVAALDATKFIVGYNDIADGQHGTTKVGSLVTGADITASTPGAYTTAAGAIKVGFVGWMKNPSA